MKKILFTVLSTLILISCGKEKSEETVNEVVEAEVQKLDKFSVVLEGVYQKDDSLSLVYKKDGYVDYDHPVALKVKGQELSQKFVFDIPQGVYLENFQVTLSTNKEQKDIQLNSIEVYYNDSLIFDGKAMVYVPYFNANEGLKWIEEKKSLELFFEGTYPPGISGNDKFEESLQTGTIK